MTIGSDAASWPGDRWEWYEAYVAALALLRGYHVRRPELEDRVAGAGDFGADLLLYADVRVGVPTWAVQCKVRDGPVGLGAVQEVYGAQGYYHARRALVATPSGFTEPAHALARSLGVELFVVDDHTWQAGWEDLPDAVAFQGPPSSRLSHREVIALVEHAPTSILDSATAVARVSVTRVTLGRVEERWAYQVDAIAETAAGFLRSARDIPITVFCDAVSGDRLHAAQLDPGSQWAEPGPR